MNQLVIACCYILFLISPLLNSISRNTDEQIVNLGVNTLGRVKKMDPYCNRPWPQLELFLPIYMTSNSNSKHFWRNDEYDRLFLQSLTLFWPFKKSNTSLLIIINEENFQGVIQANISSKLEEYRHFITGGINIKLTPPSEYYIKGHDRQQLLMFWADNFTTAEYVGFVDTDCVFVTYIDREDIFENGKPVINGRFGNAVDPFWKEVPLTTYDIIGHLEPMRCMNYFPVVLKTSHLKDLREYISNRFNGTQFDEVFQQHITDRSFSQFNIMCAYLYYYKRDEYTWYIHRQNPNGDESYPPDNGTNTDMSLYTPDMYYPKPRVATHARYRKPNYELQIESDISNLNLLFLRGYCWSPPFPKNIRLYDEFCQKVRSVGYYDEMYRFESFDWTRSSINSHESLVKVQSDRYDRIKYCYHHYSRDSVHSIFSMASTSAHYSRYVYQK